MGNASYVDYSSPAALLFAFALAALAVPSSL
jgi:hypothetical protein